MIASYYWNLHSHKVEIFNYEITLKITKIKICTKIKDLQFVLCSSFLNIVQSPVRVQPLVHLPYALPFSSFQNTHPPRKWTSAPTWNKKESSQEMNHFGALFARARAAAAAPRVLAKRNFFYIRTWVHRNQCTRAPTGAHRVGALVRSYRQLSGRDVTQ